MKTDKTIIGITGNIATGKSVVRRMLANAGALGLDADVIANRMIYPQGAAYPDVVKAFGEKILTENGEISRPRLGEIVFQDPDQLTKLESIIHPAVTRAILRRIDLSQTPIIALEAIKLLEAGLDEICDAVWVSHVPRKTQLERLLQTRGLTETEALSRIEAQPPQDEKFDQADVLINTQGDFKSTWAQIQAALNDTINSPCGSLPLSKDWAGPTVDRVPLDALLQLWDKQAGESPQSLYQALGAGMIQPLTRKGHLKALLGWQSWNFTAALTQALPAETLMSQMAIVLEAFAAAGRQQQSELMMLPAGWVDRFDLNPTVLGFTRCEPQALTYPAWRDAARSLAAKDRDPEFLYARILAKPLEAEGG